MPPVGKLEAARRQMDAAISLMLCEGDPLAVHTLAAAAFGILRDLSDKSDQAHTWRMLQSVIRPGKERKFWGMMGGPANFLKHADRDPEGELEFESQDANEILLMLAGLIYRDLTGHLTVEMRVLNSLVWVRHPDTVAEGPIKEAVIASKPLLDGLSRLEQIRLARKLLAASKSNPH